MCESGSAKVVLLAQIDSLDECANVSGSAKVVLLALIDSLDECAKVLLPKSFCWLR